MKNKLFIVNKYLNRRRLAGLSFWLAIAGCLAGSGLLAIWLLSLTTQSTLGRSSASTQFHWLLTSDGKRRGVIILTDLAQDSKHWELWGNGAGMPPLAPIAALCPSARIGQADFGFNGGFWDKDGRRPVGICAGERGIHGAISHPNGFAIAGERAWIGPLTAHLSLSPCDTDARLSSAMKISLNPWPIPRKSACLIDPLAYPGDLVPEEPVRLVWLDRGNALPLRFNSTVALTVRHQSRQPGGVALRLPPPGVLLWLRPESGPAETAIKAKAGDRYRLELKLMPVRGEVQLATCAGPRLLRGGKIVWGLTGGEANKKERTWRTAVGCDKNGRHLWVILLARGKDGLPGATLWETAQTLLESGASEGLNLDGGSSTSIWSNKLGAELLALFPLQFPIHHGIFFHQEMAISPM